MIVSSVVHRAFQITVSGILYRVLQVIVSSLVHRAFQITVSGIFNRVSQMIVFYCQDISGIGPIL